MYLYMYMYVFMEYCICKFVVSEDQKLDREEWLDYSNSGL